MIKELLSKYSDNSEAREAVRLIFFTNHSVFLTGKAGSGKSYLLSQITKYTRKKYVILAPTGVAALNVNGQTIHSFFKIPPRPYLPNDKGIRIFKEKAELIKKIDLVIIDEISMVRADLMEAIDEILRLYMQNDIPFGGKQLLLIGDLYQLPPVLDNRKYQVVKIINSNYSTRYFFSAKSIENGFYLHMIELQKNYRQGKDLEFASILNKIRENMANDIDLKKINTIGLQSKSQPNSQEITVATTNKIVDNINTKMFADIKESSKMYEAVKTESFKKKKESELPAPSILEIKRGAQIMFIKNDSSKRWVNGTLGRVDSWSHNEIVITLIEEENRKVNISTETWEDVEYFWNQEEKRIDKIIKGTFTQFPIKLAWAITIHKSQGKTFDRININLGNGAFETGQTYVALSRCRTLQGINLNSEIKLSDIKVDQKIIHFMQMKKENGMEIEKIEAIWKGMEDIISSLEKDNIELKKNVEEFINQNRQLQNEVIRFAKENKVAEEQISKLFKENEQIKVKLKSIKMDRNNFLILFIISLFVCGFLIYMGTD